MDEPVRDAGVLDLEAEFVSQQPDVERHDDRAQQGRGEAELDHVGVVGGERGDACSLLDAGIGEHGRQPCRADGYLRVDACARLPGEGDPVTPELGASMGEVADQHPCAGAGDVRNLPWLVGTVAAPRCR